jgi:hypothetical protein
MDLLSFRLEGHLAAVVSTDLHPVRISAPVSSKCVAKLCRRVWQVARFVGPACATARLIARWSMLSWR